MSELLEYRNGPICGIENCPSRRYAEHDDGMTYCERGHQRIGEVATQRDQDDFGTEGRKSRQEKEVQEKVSRIYRGAEALQLYLQAYQLILRKQCWVLVHTFQLPAEIETVLKDLWELRVQLLENRLDIGADAEAVFSSQQQSDREEGNDHQVRKKWEARGKKTPGVLESLCLIYMAASILRLPVSIGDLHRWAVREDIPFIRVIREVPSAMKEKLPGQYRGALDTQSPLRCGDLRNAAQELMLLYNHSFGLVLPNLNHPLFLIRYVRDLALPLDIYNAVRSISKLLSIDFSFPEARGRHRTISFPEVQLMALVIVAVKLYHPFDTLDRYAASPTNLGIFQIDWQVWCSHHQQYANRETSDGKLGRGNEMRIKEQDVFRMSEAQLDEYLDWYEKTWVNEPARRPRKGDLPHDLLDMFPTGRIDGSVAPTVDITETIAADQAALDAKLAAVQASLRTRGVIREEEEADRGEPVRRIGSFYKRYRKEGDLPPHARTFFEAAASLIGAELSTMVLAVLQTEQLLLNYRNRGVRASREKEGEEDGMEGVEEVGEGGEGFVAESEDVELRRDSLDSDDGVSDDS